MKLRLHKHRHAKNCNVGFARFFVVENLAFNGLFTRLWYTIFVNMCHFIYGKKKLDIS